MDMGIGAMVVPPAVTGIVGLGLWFVLKRPLEQWSVRTEHLENEVAQLRDNRIARIEENMDRQGEDIVRVKTHFVHKSECGERHRAAADQMAVFSESVLKLERVGERCDEALHRTELLNEQQVALQRDLAGLAGKIG